MKSSDLEKEEFIQSEEEIEEVKKALLKARQAREEGAKSYTLKEVDKALREILEKHE